MRRRPGEGRGGAGWAPSLRAGIWKTNEHSSTSPVSPQRLVSGLHLQVSAGARGHWSLQLALGAPAWFCCFSRTGTEATSRGQRSGADPNCMISHAKGQGPLPGEERLPWGRVLAPVLPVARHLGLSPWWPVCGCKFLSQFVQLSQLPHCTCQGIFQISASSSCNT